RHAREVLGALARRVDVGDDGDVRARQRAVESARERLGAGGQVRLEGGDDAGAIEGARSSEGRGPLGRLVGVVVVDGGAAVRFAERLEYPGGAREVGERSGRAGEVRTSEAAGL